MFIRAGIVRDHVRAALVRATLVRGTLVRATFNRAKIHLLQPGLSDHVRAHMSEPCLSKPGLSETLSGTMTKRHLSGPLLSEPELSETMSECTFIARIFEDSFKAILVRATSIRP